MTAQIMNKKQLLIYNTDSESGETIIQNAYLVAAINIHQIPENVQISCHLNPSALVDFTEAKNQKGQLLNKTHGMVFYDGAELLKLDAKAINVLMHSQVVVTTSPEVNPSELYTKLIELVKKDDEKEEKLRTLNGLLESVVLFIKKNDFNRLQNPASLKIKPLFKEAATPIEGLINEMNAWAGIEKDLLLYHLSDSKDDNFNVLAMKLVKVLKDIADQKEKNKDRLKKLEIDKKVKELEAFKAKVAEQEEKTAKDIQEKIQKLKDQGFSMGAEIDSLVDKVVRGQLAHLQKEEEKEISHFDILAGQGTEQQDDKMKSQIEKIIETKVTEYREDVMSDDQKTKSDQTILKDFYDKITSFDDRDLPQEYDFNLSQFSQMFGSRTLVNILVHTDLLPDLLPSLLTDEQKQRTFTCFIKSAFQEGLVMHLSSGIQQQLKIIKKIIKEVFKYCAGKADVEPYCKSFIKGLLHFDVLDQGSNTVKAMYASAPKGVREHFNSEDNILKEANPFFVAYVVKLFLDYAPDYLISSASHKSVSTFLPNIFNICLNFVLLFQDDQRSGVSRLLFSILLKILAFAGDNLVSCTKIGVMQYLLNNELLKMMVKAVDYDSSSSSYNNQMKMLLEMHMKLIDMHNEIIEKEIAVPAIDSNLENSTGILSVKRGKKVLKERTQFDFIKYLVHYEGLDDHYSELLNQTIETNHYAFDTKVLVKYERKQVEMVDIKFNERIKLREFGFLAIGSNPKKEKDMECYSQEDITTNEKEIKMFKGSFYIVYPVIKQLVVAFGEGQGDRLGVGSSSNSLPKACYKTKNLKAKRVLSSYWHTVIVDSDDRLWRCGQIKRSSGNASEYELVDTIKEKVKLVTVGKFNIMVVTEDNKIYRQGFSKEGHLGLNTDYQQMTRFEKVNDEEQITENIVDISSGTHFTLFVTESGKLYGIGDRFLKEMSLDCDSKIIPIPLKEGVKALKAYSSMAHLQPSAIIKVRNENGQEQLMSAGRNEQGLLGQGALIKTSKIFKPLKYDHEKIQFTEVSLHSDHAMAIDQNGQLYGWGSNLQKRAGFKEDIYDGIFEPKRITFYESENLLPLKVSCGFDHSLILFQDRDTQQHKVYTVGANETNFHHLGIPQVEASISEQFYREVSNFRGLSIVDISAGHRSSHVIIQGDKDIQSNLYEHRISQEKTVNGILHFYFDQAKGGLQYISEEDYPTEKDSLPDISFAIKCPIEDLEKNYEQLFPDLAQLTSEMIDNTAVDATHQDIEDDLIQKPLDGSIRYFSYSKINGDEQKINLSENSFNKPNIYDVNPLVFYRLKKPLKKGARLPVLNSSTFYKETADYGLDISIEPDLSFEKNDKLIELTKQSYEELTETINKFSPELDSDLLREMDRYVKANLSDKDLASITAKDDFKLSDMTFKNSKLKKLPENVKRRRLELYLHFNQMFIELMPYISLEDNSSRGDMSKQFQEVKNMILFSMKNKFIQNAINSLPSGSSATVDIKRRKAQKFCEKGGVDHKGEFTIFGQIFQQIKSNKSFECFRQNSVDTKCWRTNFLGEGSIDAGGPFREGLTNMCAELESDNLPLLIKTANNRNNHGDNRDSFIPNPKSNSPSHTEMFKFLGHLIGYSIRTLCPLPLHLAPIFWKLLLNDHLELSDLKGFDTYSWQVIEDLKKQSAKLSPDDFNLAVSEKFVTRLSDGTEVELKLGGRDIQVTKDNLQEYIDLMLQCRFQESSNQMKEIKEGINYVIPIDNLKLFTWEEVESRACGDKIVDIEKFKKITNYSGCTEDHEQVQRFWRVFEGFTDEERQLYLKFVWGRSRLPYETDGLRDRHELYLMDYKDDKDFPEAHTCFFQLDLPCYSSDEICKKRLITAITMCGEIDADRDAAYIDDDDDEDVAGNE